MSYFDYAFKSIPGSLPAKPAEPPAQHVRTCAQPSPAQLDARECRAQVMKPVLAYWLLLYSFSREVSSFPWIWHFIFSRLITGMGNLEISSPKPTPGTNTKPSYTLYGDSEEINRMVRLLPTTFSLSLSFSFPHALRVLSHSLPLYVAGYQHQAQLHALRVLSLSFPLYVDRHQHQAQLHTLRGDQQVKFTLFSLSRYQE